MLTEIRWILIQAIQPLWNGGSDRSWYAWFGYALLLLAILMLLPCIRAIITLRPVRAAGCLLTTFILAVIGSAMVCFGTHASRGASPGETTITGAQICVFDGPATADLGTLFLIGGYGSESPAFCEPAGFRQQPADSADPIVSRFRKRVIVHLHGGFGWNDSAKTANLAAALRHWLETNASEWKTAGRFNIVCAHSRGAQVLAYTPWFREHGWKCIAVHPAAAVNLHFRLLDFASPEITEIHRTGEELLREFRYGGGHKLHPWDIAWQAWGWDFMVQRFPADTGIDLRNTDPFASHITPYGDRNSQFWQEFAALLPPKAATRVIH